MTKKRADAERNIAAILAAAGHAFGRGEAPAMGDIAGAAGVRRATLYAHFPSREELLEAVVRRGITTADEVLTGLRLDEEPPERALTHLLERVWPVLDRHRRLRQVALRELGPERLRAHHDLAMQHVERLVQRGQDSGSFRADLPLDWLIASFYAVLHAAADEADAGRLSPADAPKLLVATILPMFTSPQRVQ